METRQRSCASPHLPKASPNSANVGNLKHIVFKGPFTSLGMPDFTGKLSEDDVVKIQAFILGTADAVRPKN